MKPEIVNFILNYRKAHPGIDKEAFKPIVDRFCNEINSKPTSVSTISENNKVFERKGITSRRRSKKIKLLCKDWQIL